MKLNEIQEKAVKEIEKNISLVAGAGTGKTRVLTNRFVEITKYTDSKKILALTFTKKAANEMKTRILQALVSKNINRDDLNVMTIHSFCLEIIREYVNFLKIDPNFSVSSEKESRRLILESIREAVEKNQSEDFLDFIYDFSFDIKNILDTFYNLYSEIKNFNINISDIEENTFKAYYSKYNIMDLKEKLDLLSANKSLRNLNKFINSEKYYDIFNGDNFSEEDLNLIRDSLGTSKKFNLQIDEINRIIEDLSLTLDNENHKYYKVVLNILKDINNIYLEKKFTENMIDYDDQMIFLNQLLDIQEIRNDLRERFSYILVDEFQDTNEIQNSILKKIDPENLFIVGDPKQSIYGFRGSEVESYHKFSRNLEDNGIALNMDINYRTSENIISGVNSIFSKIMDNYISLKAARESIIDIEFFEIKEDLGNSLSKLVVNLLEKYKYEDILILSRSNNQLDEIYDMLRLENIPSKKPKIFLIDEGIIRYVLNLLSSVYNGEDLLGFLSYINSGYVNLNFNRTIEILLSEVTKIEDILKLEIEDENFKKAIFIYEKLLKYKDKLFIDELLNLAIKELSKFNHISKNEYRYLYILVDMAREFLKENSNNFREFEEYINDEEIDDLNDGVTISTIHRSKGLEYKVVILYNMEKKLSIPKKKFLIHRDYGLAINSPKSSGKHSIMKNILEKLEEEEEKRVFYVAATRAKDRLIFASKIVNSNSLNYFNFIKDSLESFKKLNIDGNKIFIPYISDSKLKYISKRKNLYRFRENYSISDFLNFKISKRHFYENYYFEKDSIINSLNKSYLIDPIVKGNIIHEFAAKYSGSYDEKFIRDIFYKYGEEYTEEKFNDIKPYLDNYLEMKDIDIRNRELGFYYDFSGNVVRGFIDQIIYKDGYYLVDLKASENSKDKILEYYEPQLVLYSKIYEDIYDIKLKGAYIYSIKTKEKIPVNISRENKDRVADEFLKFIDFIRNNINYKDY